MTRSFFVLCCHLLYGKLGALRTGKGGSSEVDLSAVEWRVNFVSSSSAGGQTTFTYRVTCPEFTDLSHWGLLVSETESFSIDTGSSTPGWLSPPGSDGSTGGIWMIKFDTQIDCPTTPGSDEVVLVLNGDYDECEGQYLVKGSTEYALGSVIIPCEEQTVSGEGDPHLQNIHGEFFDVWKLGDIDLLRLPQNREHPAHLLVQGTISKVRFADGHVDDDCDGPVITAVHMSGNWLGTRNQSLNVSLDIEKTGLKTNLEGFRSKQVILNTTEDKKFRLSVHDIELTVEAIGRYDRQYLRFVAEHVTRFHGKVGGLLGSDDHSDESLRPDVCGEAHDHHRVGMFRSPAHLMALAS